MPRCTRFKPVGRRLGETGEVRVLTEELEALRLKDLEGLDQLASAERMGVSRPTFQRVLRSARGKVAHALIEGLTILVEGGDYELAARELHCRACGHNWEEPHGSGRGRESFPCPQCGSMDVAVRHPDGRRHSH
jgi:uncharacterized protein